MVDKPLSATEDHSVDAMLDFFLDNLIPQHRDMQDESMKVSTGRKEAYF